MFFRGVVQPSEDCGDEEEDVFSYVERVEVKTYSTEKASRYLYGQGYTSDILTQNLTQEEKEAIERARYCRKLLLQLKARQMSAEAGETGEMDIKQIIQQEELQEWLENLELRLRQKNWKEASGSMVEDIPGWLVAPFGFKVSTSPVGAPVLEITSASSINTAIKAATAAVRWKAGSTGMRGNSHADGMASVESKLPPITSLGGSADDPMAAEMEAALADLVARLCGSAEKDLENRTPRSEITFKATPRAVQVKSLTPNGSPRSGTPTEFRTPTRSQTPTRSYTPTRSHTPIPSATPTQPSTPTTTRSVRFKEKITHLSSIGSKSSSTSTPTRTTSKTIVTSIPPLSPRHSRSASKVDLLKKAESNGSNNSLESGSTLTIPEAHSIRRSASPKGRGTSQKSAKERTRITSSADRLPTTGSLDALHLYGTPPRRHHLLD